MMSGPDIALLVAAHLAAGTPCPRRTCAILQETWPPFHAEATLPAAPSPAERRLRRDRREQPK